MNNTNKTKIVYLGNQGGVDVIDFYTGIAKEISKSNVEQKFLVWLEAEKKYCFKQKIPQLKCESFEKFNNKISQKKIKDTNSILKKYPRINWSQKIAVERAFTDYSMLLGASGERIEDLNYVTTLVSSIVKFLEKEIKKYDVLICQTADTLFTMISIVLAKELGVKVYASRPAVFMKLGNGGGFFVNDEYLKCTRMIKSYELLKKRKLTKSQICRSLDILDSIKNFKEFASYHAKTSKGKYRGKKSISPNINKIFKYIKLNSNKNKYIEYIKIEIRRKVVANLLRLYRKYFCANNYGFTNLKLIPKKSIFFPIQFQPEESTLTQGVWFSNQIALAENLSKSMPFGYTLIIKEHPWGRGNRPGWHYKHLNNFYNVKFCDANSKKIIPLVEAVITVSGTVALECLAFDKPCIVLGHSFYDFFDLFYKINNIKDLNKVLTDIIVNKDYQKIKNRNEKIHKFFNSYLDAIIPYFPLSEYSNKYGEYLVKELHLLKLKV